MCWARIEDDAPENAKLDALSDSALRLWLMANCVSRLQKNLWLKGFIPRDSLATIARGKWPAKVLDKLVAELTRVHPQSRSRAPLWEPAEDRSGWQIHDWEKYSPPQPPMSSSEAASIAGKRSAEARRSKHGTAVPNGAPNAPRTSPNVSKTFEGRSSHVRPNAFDRTVSERPEPLDLENQNINLSPKDLKDPQVRPLPKSGRDAKNTEESASGTVPVGSFGRLLRSVTTTGFAAPAPLLKTQATQPRPQSVEELDRCLDAIPRGAFRG